jgi:hypothetical protein
LIFGSPLAVVANFVMVANIVGLIAVAVAADLIVA